VEDVEEKQVEIEHEPASFNELVSDVAQQYRIEFMKMRRVVGLPHNKLDFITLVHTLASNSGDNNYEKALSYMYQFFKDVGLIDQHFYMTWCEGVVDEVSDMFPEEVERAYGNSISSAATAFRSVLMWKAESELVTGNLNMVAKLVDAYHTTYQNQKLVMYQILKQTGELP
jgi:hypothetical protein